MRFLLIILVLFSAGRFFWNVRISDKNVAFDEVREKKSVLLPSPEPKQREHTPPVATSTSQLDQLTTKIDSLQEEKEQLRHGLEMQGFPKILENERLSDVERVELLKKLSQLNDMDLRLMRLKNQKLELETEVSL